MNSKTLPTIALLTVSSAGAFGLGWVLKPAPPAQPLTEAANPTLLSGTPSLTPEERSRSEAAGGNRARSPISDYLPVSGPMTAENIASAVEAMAKENDPLKKSAMMTALLEQLTPENAKAAFEALQANRGGRRGPGRGGDDEMRLLLNAWGRIDGKAAIAEVTAMAEAARANGEDRGGRGGWGGRDGGGDAFDIYSILSGWAMTDSGSALEYVNSLEGDDRRKAMYTAGIVRGLMVNGVEDAVGFISSLPADDNGTRGRYMATVAEEMLENGVTSAAQWASTLQDPDLKSGAMDRIASEYARQDLQGAIDWVAEHAGHEYARSAVSEIAEEWAEKDPQAVIKWANDLPADTQTRVFQEAFDEWTESDPLAASQYLAQMPASNVRDSAVEGFARELAREDPQAAAVWAGTIGDQNARTSALTDVARNWLRTDRAAAEAWLPESGLPQDAQQAVLESRRGGFDGFRGGGRRR